MKNAYEIARNLLVTLPELTLKTVLELSTAQVVDGVVVRRYFYPERWEDRIDIKRKKVREYSHLARMGVDYDGGFPKRSRETRAIVFQFKPTITDWNTIRKANNDSNVAFRRLRRENRAPRK